MKYMLNYMKVNLFIKKIMYFRKINYCVVHTYKASINVYYNDIQMTPLNLPIIVSIK